MDKTEWKVTNAFTDPSSGTTRLLACNAEANVNGSKAAPHDVAEGRLHVLVHGPANPTLSRGADKCKLG